MPLSHISALILAAGKGTRMCSTLPKVMQKILDEPMLSYVLEAAKAVCHDRVWTVVGYQSDILRGAYPEYAGHFIEQEQQLGTGHALQVAWPTLRKSGASHVLVLNGDTPLIRESILREFLLTTSETKADVAFITLNLIDPGMLGRVVRINGKVTAVIEAKDYDEDIFGPETNEVNAGVYCLSIKAVEKLLPRLQNKNNSGEFYITDLISLAHSEGMNVVGDDFGNDMQLLGINTPHELIRSEEFARAAIVTEHLGNGVIIRNPAQVRIGPHVSIGKGSEITGPCEIYGKSAIGPCVNIASHTVLHSVEIKANAAVKSFSHLEKAKIGENAAVGPYARLRPGAVLEESARVGNFVEVKNSVLKKGAKASHLTYLGDSEIGENANIGAGTITCNYDGKKKHRTSIGAGTMVGSNSALVAPVTVGANAVVGAGSVITSDVPDNCLAVARQRQKNMPRKIK